MKKAIFVMIVVGMLGWAVYEFVFTTDDNKVQEDNKVISQSKIRDINEEETESNVIGIGKGEMAPDFELTTLEGEIVKLSDFKGQRIMLNFWATWCPPCRAEMPDMQKFQEKKDVKILAVNLLETESNPDKVQKFIDDFNLTLTVPLDEESVVSDQYQIMAYPTSFMIDSKGRIQFIALGALNYNLMVQEFEKMQ
ncbi:TlpA family protein disulfide reductase [Bacillus sp. FSL K6-3431]|uniref:TlpA family protein disulfide reductase n=1 Tax=Bacillus sp. FSL K6-3431 TaxID=2921500 RepID=UPI0030F79C73